ncbi:hypothetical protein MBLNU459_g3523t3 [Dothideomycetes sp. NU459]
MDASASSKVTVEYHDPSGVFSLISRDLASRLPLRNLNWKSPTRPLRSIGALQVEFVPSSATVSASDSTGEDQLQSVDSGKERRHQIPGLRQTPYLKIYLLRCDDKDAYKESARQLLREWIRENAPSTQSSTSVARMESHDASEWLILHVVIPDTIAASEPRWTAASKDPDELVERPQTGTKWPGKSTRTVLDKIRADFNSSSKSNPERVAQIRLQKSDVPPEVIPKTPAPSPYVETKQEQENAWQDLVSKFKTLILGSFAQRVTQYEDDIREKDSQRSLPGWNFCTFFTLKEGLAIAFERVGLVEDALAIYDELSAGLETAVREDASGSSAANSTFLGDLDEYRIAMRNMAGVYSDTSKFEKLAQPLQAMLNQPLALSKDDFRGAIVSSTISLFHFQTYIFARQRTLLLRLGGGGGSVQQPRVRSAQTAPKDSMTFAAEVCRRAAVFAATNARALLQGLKAGPKNEDPVHLDRLVEYTVSSWTYNVLEQILEETASDLIPSTPTSKPNLQRFSTGGYPRKDANNFNFPQGANPHPTRNSSLQRSFSGSSATTLQPSPQVIYENERYTKSSILAQGDGMPSSSSGVVDLAAGRAELLLMQRRIIEALAKRKGWLTGWTALIAAKSMVDVDLNKIAEDDSEPQGNKDTTSDSDGSAVSTLLSQKLSSALASMESFRSTYEHISNQAVTLYNAADHAKSADTVTSDLAILKFQMRDYAQAATYFQRSSVSYMQTSWAYVHGEMLRNYAKCLKELHRKDEYMRVMLSLLGKATQRARSLPGARMPGSAAWVDEETIDVGGFLDELVVFSDELPYNFIASMMDFFTDIRVDPEVLHYTDKDGFSLRLQFRNLFEDMVDLDRIKLRLVLAGDPSREIWLESAGIVNLRSGVVKLNVSSNITTYGHYLIDKLVLEVKKLHFVHEFQPKPQMTPLGITNASNAERKSALAAREIHIDQPRSIILEVDTGWNDIESLDLRLRSASAGLRLNTANASISSGQPTTLDTSQAGTVRLKGVVPKTQFSIKVPYSLEHSHDEVSVRLEAHYITAQGPFVFLNNSTIPIGLPLDVDVQDVFKAQALFSKFSIRTTNAIPLQITQVQLEESAAFAVQPLPSPSDMAVFEKQPASLTYRILKKEAIRGTEISKKDAALALTLDYHCMDEVILDCMENALESSVSESAYASLRRLLIPVLANKARSLALVLQLETAVLLGEISVPTYEDIGWDSVLSNLRLESRDGLVQWLRDWHKRNPKLQFSPQTSGTPRRITISVDVPTIDVVHTATLTLRDRPLAISAVEGIVGAPLLADVRIRHTRRWNSSSAPLGKGSEKLDFVYTLQDVSDVWLIGGQRRAHFSFSSEDDEATFAVILVPLKPGTHLLPHVDICAVTAGIDTKKHSMQGNRQSVDVGGGDKAAGVAVTCETDYRNSGESVLVVRDARTTTATVRESVGLQGVREIEGRVSEDSRLSRAVA